MKGAVSHRLKIAQKRTKVYKIKAFHGPYKIQIYLFILSHHQALIYPKGHP